MPLQSPEDRPEPCSQDQQCPQGWPGPRAGLWQGLLRGLLGGEQQRARGPRLRRQGVRWSSLLGLCEGPLFCLGMRSWEDLLELQRWAQGFSPGSRNYRSPPSLAQGHQTFLVEMGTGFQDSQGPGDSLRDPGGPGAWRQAGRDARLQRLALHPPEWGGRQPLQVSVESHQWVWRLLPG